jgi:hypothetical protein
MGKCTYHSDIHQIDPLERLTQQKPRVVGIVTCWASMSRRLEFFFCGVWSQKFEQKANSANVNQVQRGPSGRSRSWGWWLPDVEVHYIVWHDFRCFWPIGMPTFDVEVRNLFRIQSIGNEGLVLASDANSCRANASLRCFVSTSQINGRVLRLWKFLIINY